MQGLSSKHMMIAAALILAGGVAWAGALLMSPPEAAKAETGTIRRLAGRIGRDSGAKVSDPTVAPVSALPEPPAPAPAPRAAAKPAAKPSSAAAARPPAVTPPPPGPAPVVQPEDPVKNIALTGVAHEGGRDVAFLLDLKSNEREQVRAGDRAFGFTLRKVEPESVVLARGSSEYTVRLGDKAVPDIYLASADTGSSFGDPNNPFGGRGRFGRGGDGFNFGRGGRGEGRRGFSGFGNRGGGFSRRFGGFGGDGSSATVFSTGGDGARGFSGGRFSGGSSSGSSSWRDRNRGGGGFQATVQFPAFGGGGFGGWNGRSSRNTSSTASRSTSNPQTARRNSSAYTYSGGASGGGGGMDTPEPISNPQTQRRLGTTSGPAFGEGQGSQYGGRSGSNRGGGNFNRFGGSTSFR